jgi:hypothetical protein
MRIVLGRKPFDGLTVRAARTGGTPVRDGRAAPSGRFPSMKLIYFSGHYYKETWLLNG